MDKASKHPRVSYCFKVGQKGYKWRELCNYLQGNEKRVKRNQILKTFQDGAVKEFKLNLNTNNDIPQKVKFSTRNSRMKQV